MAENTCQHCQQEVEWGKTEQGFAGFVHIASGLSECPMTCTKCGETIEPLSQFPDGKGGLSCLDCYAASPEGQRMPTADELVAMWGGKR